jgi:hypothetical protein
VLAGPQEGTAIGNIMLQAKAAGLVKDIWEMRKIIANSIELVKYEPVENSDTVFVCLPDVEFSQSTLSSWFKSDDEDEESAVQFDARPMIQRVENRIENRYNTPENHMKAEEKAKETLSDFLKQCGKVAVFK